MRRRPPGDPTTDTDPSRDPGLGIVAALPAEARTLGRRGLRVRTVVPIAPGVQCCVSGAGAAAAHGAAHALLAAGAGALLSWGTAGALVEGLEPGSLLLPERVRSGDREFGVDTGWRDALVRRLTGHRFRGGMLLQGIQVLGDRDAKREAGRRHGAVAVDMESGALAAAAADVGVPFLAVRAIVDPVAWTLPEAVGAALDVSGDVRVGRVLGAALIHPSLWSDLLRLARAFAAARRTLADVARTAAPRFALDERERR